jgi:hypothetical protein
MIIRRMRLRAALNVHWRSCVGEDRRDGWDLLTLAFWLVFFTIGLAPELFFSTFREAGGVTPYSALVNSSAIITVGFAIYLALFAYRRCRFAGLTQYLAQGKALEVALLALVAFLELPAMRASIEGRRTLLALVFDLGTVEDRYLQGVILFVSASKLLAWVYLFSLVLRYHAFGNRAVFTQVPSMFPSMHQPEHEVSPETAASSNGNPGALAPPVANDAEPPVEPAPRAAEK